MDRVGDCLPEKRRRQVEELLEEVADFTDIEGVVSHVAISVPSKLGEALVSNVHQMRWAARPVCMI
jgi:hypothetical protein